MPLVIFLTQAMGISLSGVMAPGPMSATVVGKGTESPHAGALIALGHGIVEFPLMAFLYFGSSYIFSIPGVSAGIGILGGAFLLWMGIGMLRSLRHAGPLAGRQGGPALLAGVVMSITNPYFLIWWATVGTALILRSVEYGVIGFVALAVAHWFCDFIWYYILSALSFKGGQFLGRRFQQVVFAGMGIFLVFMSVRFIVDGIRTLV